MNNKQPMQSSVDLDSVSYFCPCGRSITGEGNIIDNFLNNHREHTNGMCEEKITDDGARCLVTKPKPRSFKV